MVKDFTINEHGCRNGDRPPIGHKKRQGRLWQFMPEPAHVDHALRVRSVTTRMARCYARRRRRTAIPNIATPASRMAEKPASNPALLPAAAPPVPVSGPRIAPPVPPTGMAVDVGGTGVDVATVAVGEGVLVGDGVIVGVWVFSRSAIVAVGVTVGTCGTSMMRKTPCTDPSALAGGVAAVRLRCWTAYAACVTASDSNRWLQSRSVSGDAYDETYERRAAAGDNVHGEADFVERFQPASTLDAGCGTGRVARELARRGVDVVGVDLDPAMLETARRKAPEIDWRHADLATVNLGRAFDVIVMPGNVMIFLSPGTEADVIANMANHVNPAGVLIAGFQLMPGRLSIQRYDEIAAAAGLTLVERWSTWECQPWEPASTYAVSVHRHGGTAQATA